MSASRARQTALSTILSIVLGVLVFVYPFLVYLGLTRWSTRGVALFIAAWALIGLAWRSRKRATNLTGLLPIPLSVVTLMVLSVVLDDRRFILAMPVLINIVFLAGFASTLRTDLPIIERFARMQHDDLNPGEIRYCRRLTWVWVGFFAANAMVCSGLALFAPLGWWALYTGLIAYFLIGLLFAVELFVRKARFKRFDDGWLDRHVFSPLFAGPASVASGDGSHEEEL